MVGKLILDHCLRSPEVETVICFVRKPSIQSNPKLKEIILKDFKNYTDHTLLFENCYAAFFCIGVYTGSVPDAEFKMITVDYAVAFAHQLAANAPQANLCLLSGAGADQTEKSRMAFAKYKGMAENQIAAILPNTFYTFRPGYIYPVTSRKAPNFSYKIFRILYPIIKFMGKNMSIKSTELAEAMFHIGLKGNPKQVFENKEIIAYLKTKS